eukprot:1151765-Pelagomonas_calceolata.AAC.4
MSGNYPATPHTYPLPPKACSLLQNPPACTSIEDTPSCQNIPSINARRLGDVLSQSLELPDQEEKYSKGQWGTCSLQLTR